MPLTPLERTFKRNPHWIARVPTPMHIYPLSTRSQERKTPVHGRHLRITSWVGPGIILTCVCRLNEC
jgi:hypothetical protein